MSEVKVEVNHEGLTQTHVGQLICEGPGQVRLLRTQPFARQGEVVEIPLTAVEKIDEC